MQLPHLDPFLTWVIIGSLALLAFNILTGLLERYLKARRGRAPYIPQGPLLSRTEQRFYFNLKRAIPPDYLIFAQVSLSAILDVRPMNKEGRKTWGSKINSLCLDFVICDQQTFHPVMIIELDDPTHYRKDRQARDRFLDFALDSADIPIWHVTDLADHTIPAIQHELTDYLEAQRPTPHQKEPDQLTPRRS